MYFLSKIKFNILSKHTNREMNTNTVDKIGEA